MADLQITSYRRDYTEADSDYFGLVLDTFHDNRNAELLVMFIGFSLVNNVIFSRQGPGLFPADCY